MPDLNATGGEPDKGLSGSDPTALTTDALNREVAVLRDLIQDKANEANRAATDLEKLTEVRLSGEVRVLEERMRSILNLMELEEQNRVERKRDTEKGVDAALAAAKELGREQALAAQIRTDKAEAAMDKRVEQMGETFQASIRGVATSQSDIKERIGDLAASKRGGKEMLIALSTIAGLLVSLIIIGGLVAATGGFG